MESIVEGRRQRLAEERREWNAQTRRERRAGFSASAGLHVAIAVAAGYWPLREAIATFPAGQFERADPAVFFVDALPPDPSALPGLQPMDPALDNPALRLTGESTSVTIRGFTFDFTKIGERATMLFPFLTPGIALDRFVLRPKAPDQRLHVPAEYVQAAKSPGDVLRPPLELSEGGVQVLVDKSWARRDRLTAFKPLAHIAETHHPNDGKLPALLRGYTEQNGLQPYTDPGIRDLRLWTELQIAADHVEFIGFISRYASEHPSTRATIELLFLLDKIAQASRDALVTLLDTEPYGDLEWTRRANLDALTFVARLRHHFEDVLEAKKLAPRELLGAYYDNVRINILTGILNTTPDGYRASDAHLLLGMIYWRQGRKVEAVRSWRQVALNPDDAYVVANTDMVAEMRAANLRPGQSVSEREIERILAADYGRWISTSIDRLRKFGFRMDQY